MDSSLSSKTDRLEQTEVEDLKSEFTSECSFLPDAQHSCLGEKQHLQVYLRIRPFTPEETKRGESQDCVTMEGPDSVLLRPPSSSVTARYSLDRALPQAGQRFRFSKVYGPETTQRELFDGTVKDLVKDALEGRSSLVFTYGVTNAGKTFTFLGPDADAGILPRSLDVIFNSVEGRVFSGTSIKPHRCREFTRLSEEQQAEEASFKRNLFRQTAENEKSKSSLSSLSGETFLSDSFSEKTSPAAEDGVSLKVEANTKFSVWVSFCEIYNENIHDLLEVAPGAALRRTALRLSQDIKGNAFIKDLRWVQVDSAEEAYKVVKLGKKNQSFCSTRLNNLSSRSHSIFSIRILRIEDVDAPRVSTVSELCLCDLAGSERCAKTQNKGERLKEAGNINTSLLILGKCINALRHKQQTKLLQHVPFRESKLTHYLQGFFCGRGKTCMIVNINQCASMYDETLGVLKFSAVAQKVVVLFSRPLSVMPLASSSEVALNPTAERKALYSSDRSSLIGWESSLDDVQEDEDYDEDVSCMDDTADHSVNEDDEKTVISKGKLQRLIGELKQLQVQLKKERAESMLLEGRIREETSQEFSQLFQEMQTDFTERLAREREILEERAEKRMQICKNLINKIYTSGSSQDAQDMDTSAELADSAEEPRFRQSSGQAGPQTFRTDAGTKLETDDPQKTQKQQDDDPDAVEEKRRLVLQLQEKSAEAARLTEQLEELQKLLDQASTTRSEERSPQRKHQLEEALAALEKVKTEKEEALAALEYQTLGKEEALAFLEEERKAREEAVASLKELRRLTKETQEMLEREKSGREKAAAALEAEKRTNEEFVSELSKEKQSREEAHAALCEERRRTQEVQSALESERKRNGELAEAGGRMQEEIDALKRELGQLAEKLEAAEQQVDNKSEVAEQALAQLGSVQTQLETESNEVQEKTCQLKTLTQKLQTLNEELLESHISSEGDRDKVKEELLELKTKLAEQEDQTEKAQSRVQELERELTQVSQQLAQNQLLSEQISEKLSQTEASSKEEREGMLHKLTGELRAQFERESKEEVDQLRAELQEQIRQLNEQLQQRDVQHEDWTQKLSQENETASKELKDLKEKLSQKEEALELLEAELKSKLNSNVKTEEDLRRLNSDLQSEVTALKATLSNVEAKESSLEEMKELKKASEDREAELQKKVLEAEAQVATLQKSLQAAQEKREEDECQAVREARRKEAERRKELLAVAHEAIAQKDAELEKKAEEISRLKETAKQDAEKMKSLSLDLQRREDDSSDLQEKLTDYKKQMQQVQKEISAMREEEKLLRQKLSDMEKTKKQLQSDLSTRDRTIQQLRLDQSNTKCDETHQLYSKACKDLEAKERVLEEMRSALVEQDDTQEKMEKALEEKLLHIQELCSEVERLKSVLLQQRSDGNPQGETNHPSDQLKQAKEETAQVQESLKMLTDKHQTERKKWLEEKLSLIGQAKEAEDKRNQEMRKFAEDRERYSRQQGQLESQLEEKEKTMENWRKDRDTLVAALEVQLKKLLCSQAEKDKIIEQLRLQNTQPPAEVQRAESSSSVADLQASVSEKEAEILQLRRELEESRAAQSSSSEGSATLTREPKCENPKMSGSEDVRASGSSQGSAGFPSVLDSSEISTENGRSSRFPRPELEISFSPLQPNRMALRRQGEESAVTVKISRTARKRKSGEMEKEEVEAENRRNTRSKLTPRLTPQKEDSSSPAGRHDSQSSVRSRKEGTLQKIGDFLQSSPTLLGSKAKKMMSLVSGRADAESAASSSSLALRAKKTRKLYRPEISSPMEMPSHPILNREPESKESDHNIIKRRLRSRVAK
ncbi:kinesin-like protein KIF20B isoform X2 [Oryzias melastigma]|uniref:Kinesin family member 20Ba n=1 Tax=Oryzias melastigma TaxID=30732 RepID=A0A3B3C6Q2_ORYME|nr:kinesin-like protein KIF20B isoform X2 [Oryzias melastigma]